MFSLDQIRAGFEAKEFFVEYLPTISLADNRCVGGETLVRWQLPDRVVRPIEFIVPLENTTLSGTLTYWIIETVASELGAWMREEDVHISINVPPEILGRGGVRYAIEKSNLLGLNRKLMVEVTERGLPDALGIAAIAEAECAGLLVALDDVDMNEANLVVLSRLRTDVVKFDKRFADRLLRPDWARQDIDGLAALIQTGGFKVIVEGVESADQVAILKEAGVQMAQGFYFSKPLAAAKFIEYFSAHQSPNAPV
jgi:sensor c-di-GMP phosphodiesterase-like protein